MANAEEAFPKEKEKRDPNKPVPIAPRAPLPDWMKNRKLLPKKPPGQSAD